MAIDSFTEYQKKAASTAVYPIKDRITYPALGLCGEVGEVMNAYKRTIRDDITLDDIRDDLKSELGDCLWYLAVLARDLELRLDEIAEQNLQKLAERKQRGTLQGSGDTR
jgi:NTP pyrophosphatase (non-canonical NTP hydrolase)